MAAAHGLLRLGLNEKGQPALFLNSPKQSKSGQYDVGGGGGGNGNNKSRNDVGRNGLRKQQQQQQQRSSSSLSRAGNPKSLKPATSYTARKSRHNGVNHVKASFSGASGTSGSSGKTAGNDARKPPRSASNRAGKKPGKGLPLSTIKETLREGKDSPSFAPISNANNNNNYNDYKNNNNNNNQNNNNDNFAPHSYAPKNDSRLDVGFHKTIPGEIAPSSDASVAKSTYALLGDRKSSPITTTSALTTAYHANNLDYPSSKLLPASATHASASASALSPVVETLAEKKRRQWDAERRQTDLFLTQEKQKANVSLHFPTPSAMRTNVFLADADVFEQQQQQQHSRFPSDPTVGLSQSHLLAPPHHQTAPPPSSYSPTTSKTPTFIPPAAMRSSFTVGNSSDHHDFNGEKERQRREWLKDLEAQKKDAEERKRREKQRDSFEGLGGSGGAGGGGGYLWTDQQDVEREKRRKRDEWREEVEKQKRDSEGKKKAEMQVLGQEGEIRRRLLILMSVFTSLVKIFNFRRFLP